MREDGMKEEGQHSLDLDYKPKLPLDKSMGIGIVGADEIVQYCHLPAYKLASFRVVGIYDIVREKANNWPYNMKSLMYSGLWMNC